jgi:hypothetical protein
MTTHTFSFRTSFGQFHLIDDESYPDPSEVWTEETCKNRLATTDGFVGIGTLEGYADVEVTIVVGKRCPESKITTCDHVVECSLEIKSGRLLVVPCASLDETQGVNLDPGWYRLCILCDWTDTTTVEYERRRDRERRRERYIVYIWPSEYATERVRKRRIWVNEKKGWSDVQVS